MRGGGLAAEPVQGYWKLYWFYLQIQQNTRATVWEVFLTPAFQTEAHFSHITLCVFKNKVLCSWECVAYIYIFVKSEHVI